MRVLLAFVFLACSGAFTQLHSQTFIYTNQWMSFDSMLVSLTNGRVLPQHSQMQSDAILTVLGDKIYKGNSTSGFDVLYTFSEGKLYSGDSTFLTDLLYTVQGGSIYRGDSTFPLDCLYTYQGSTGILYEGKSTFPLDAELYLDGDLLNGCELCAVLLALGLL
ncbi:MAG: hypothetical protein ACKVOK_03695 [Flavobacteriales bacterium]